MVDTRRTSGGNKSTRSRSTSNSNRAGGEIYDFGALDQFEKNKRLANQSKCNASNTSCDDNSNDQNGIPGSIVESRIVKFNNILPIGKKRDCPVYGYILKEKSNSTWEYVNYRHDIKCIMGIKNIVHVCVVAHLTIPWSVTYYNLYSEEKEFKDVNANLLTLQSAYDNERLTVCKDLAYCIIDFLDNKFEVLFPDTKDQRTYVNYVIPVFIGLICL